MHRLFEGERRIDALPAAHRGIAYGDGLFETMRVHRGALPWWDRHVARLSSGAGRLRIPLPKRATLDTEVASMSEAQGDGVVKLVVSRGIGGRGYAPDPGAPPLWQLSTHPLPPSVPEAGLALRWCETRMAVQPLLAGIKHCNRLEQVMARAECTEADEGLVCDSEGQVVCATAANLFMLREGIWRTPPVDRCGVAGVCRGWVLDVVGAREERITPANVESAEAVFLCNAVRGILPVARLGARHWDPHPDVVELRRQLASAHPAFAS